MLLSRRHHRSNRSYRSWQAALVAVGMLLASLASASSAEEPCTTMPAPGTPRESSTYRESVPSLELQSAIAGYLRGDPDASFSFFNCEVDFFATVPKTTVPSYAVPTLTSLGLSTTPRAPERVPAPTDTAKPAQNLDADLSRKVPLDLEEDTRETGDAEPLEILDGIGLDPGLLAPTQPENRTAPAIVLEPRDNTYRPATPEQTALESRAAAPILDAFLSQNESVFRPMGSSLQMSEFRIGRFGRRALFEQMPGGVKLLESRTVVLFDNNWNVAGISRMIASPAKLYADRSSTVPEADAVRIAKGAAAAALDIPEASMQVASAEHGIDAIGRHMAWHVRLLSSHTVEFDATVAIHAGTGAVLNISDDVMHYTDAKLRRWGYTNGDEDNAVQVVAGGQYTADDNTMRHDYFYMQSDERDGGGDPAVLPAACVTANGWGANTRVRANAYGTTSGAVDAIRHTHRPDRDFSIWSPAHSAGSFAESHAYYWARKYFLWQKTAFEELGALPVSNSKKLNILVNTCINDVGIANSTAVATQHNEAESNPKNWIVEFCRSGLPACPASSYANSGNDFITCQGGGCSLHPSVIHHEINHYAMGTLFGVGSSINCNSGVQLGFLHEGGLGSAVPQAFWHYWYGVGYNPPVDRLFTADVVRGQVHASNATRLTVGNYLCVNNDDGGQGAYEAGRVAGQPLWEIYHGKKVSGSTITNMLRPATDTDFQILTFWAADLVAGSTYKDRYEMANRFMQVILNYGNFTSAAQKASVKADWCETWTHHSLGTFINDC
ncbi:MAG TPA: hypothetical protein VGB64_13145 [Actinomycetota bacterium]